MRCANKSDSGSRLAAAHRQRTFTLMGPPPTAANERAGARLEPHTYTRWPPSVDSDVTLNPTLAGTTELRAGTGKEIVHAAPLVAVSAHVDAWPPTVTCTGSPAPQPSPSVATIWEWVTHMV